MPRQNNEVPLFDPAMSGRISSGVREFPPKVTPQRSPASGDGAGRQLRRSKANPGRTIDIETTDKLTDPQSVAKVNEPFGISPCPRPFGGCRRKPRDPDDGARDTRLDGMPWTNQMPHVSACEPADAKQTRGRDHQQGAGGRRERAELDLLEHRANRQDTACEKQREREATGGCAGHDDELTPAEPPRQV